MDYLSVKRLLGNTELEMKCNNNDSFCECKAEGLTADADCDSVGSKVKCDKAPLDSGDLRRCTSTSSPG